MNNFHESSLALGGQSSTANASTSRLPLMDGQSAPVSPGNWAIEDSDYRLLRNAIYQLIRIDLDHYRTQQMERRLTTLLERRQAGTWPSYIECLRHDTAELAYFQEFLTINVTSFYRDSDKWNNLTQNFLPDLLESRESSGLRAWSLGCSIGAEAYTLAMLLKELAPRRLHKIWATDIDTKVLERAKARGPYYNSELKELPVSLVQKYLKPLSETDGSYFVEPALSRMVKFAQFDLLQNKIERAFDLIVCRNVVIYFTTPVKRRVYERLTTALRPGGILFIGSTETIPNHRALGFEYVAPSFYRCVTR